MDAYVIWWVGDQLRQRLISAPATMLDLLWELSANEQIPVAWARLNPGERARCCAEMLEALVLYGYVQKHDGDKGAVYSWVR